MQGKRLVRIVIDIACLISLPKEPGASSLFTVAASERYLSEITHIIQSKVSVSADQIDFVVLTQADHHENGYFQKIVSHDLKDVISYEELEKYLSESDFLLRFWKTARKVPMISKDCSIKSFESIEDDTATLLWLSQQTEVFADSPTNIYSFKSFYTGEISVQDLAKLDSHLDQHRSKPYPRVTVYIDFDATLSCNQLVEYSNDVRKAVNVKLAETLLRIKELGAIVACKLLTSRPSIPKLLTLRLEAVVELIKHLDDLKMPISSSYSEGIELLRRNLLETVNKNHPVECETRLLKALHQKLREEYPPHKLVDRAVFKDSPHRKLLEKQFKKIKLFQQKDAEMFERYCITEVCQQYRERFNLDIEVSNALHLMTGSTDRYKGHYIAEEHGSDTEGHLIILFDDSNTEISYLRKNLARLPQHVVALPIKVNADGELPMTAHAVMKEFLGACENAHQRSVAVDMPQLVDSPRDGAISNLKL